MVRKMIFLTVLVILSVGSQLSLAKDSEVPRISKEEVKAMLGRPDVVIIDVRTFFDRKMSTKQIKGAVREDPNPSKVKSWAKKYSKGKTIVLYCS